MADVDQLVDAFVTALLEREGVQLLGGNSDASEAARAEVAAIDAKLALLMDQWTNDQITDSQLERGTAQLRPRLEEARKRQRQAEPTTAFGQPTGVSAADAWSSAEVMTRKTILRALEDMTGLTITIDPVGPGAASKTDADPYAGIHIDSSRPAKN